MTHAALTEPMTKEDWRAYVARTDDVAPARLTRAQLTGLDAAARLDYDRARDLQHSALSIVETTKLRSFRAKLERTLRLNWNAQAGARAGLIVSGPSRVGKSTMVKVVAREFELYLREQFPHLFDGPGDEYIPVGYLLVSGNATVKGMLSSLAFYYGIPVAQSMTSDSLLRVVTLTMRRCHTHLLVIDDLQLVDVRDPDGRRANDMLKSLGNVLPTTFVATGVDLEKTAFFTEGRGSSRVTQTSGRYSLVSMSWFNVDTERKCHEWIGVINALEASLVLADHEPYSLGREWKYLHDRTQGCLWSLALLIRDAADIAIADGAERIDRSILEVAQTDYATESQQESSGATDGPRTVAARRRRSRR